MKKSNKEEFINKSNEKHNYKYDYSLVDYINSKTKVKIICKEHGIFEQRPDNHINNGCPKCAIINKKFTKEQFINKSNIVHNFEYDYSLVNYINVKTKVIIICKKHGEFKQTPKNHLNKQGCPLCYGNSRLNKDEFIKRSNIIHNNKYDYSLVKYKNNKTKVKIICPVHGIFEQTPNSHLLNIGCNKCAKNILTTEQFIKKCKNIHGDKYDYSLVNYKNTMIKINIICSKHGIFNQSSIDHLNGSGCPVCSNNKKLTTVDFIDRSVKLHNNKYDYSLVKYINNYTKVKIICPIHGIFEQLPSSHLTNKGCYDCSGKKRKNYEQFIKDSKEIHNDKYDYSLVKYKNNLTEVKIICPIHGIFEQKPKYHIKNNGCPICKSSKGELSIKKYLNDNKIDHIHQKSFKDCKHINPLKFDFYIPDYNLCIEFDGKQHFEVNEYFGGIKSFKKQKLRDSIKTEYCKNNNINLLRIPYNDIDDIDNILNSYLN